MVLRAQEAMFPVGCESMRRLAPIDHCTDNGLLIRALHCHASIFDAFEQGEDTISRRYFELSPRREPGLESPVPVLA